MENKQTAVEWLIKEIKNFDSGRSKYYNKVAIYNHAYIMEKEQIKESFKDGVHEGVLTDINYLKCDNDAEYYYNETYKK